MVASNLCHWAKSCWRENPCRHSNCQGKHSSLLHPITKKVAVRDPTSAENITQHGKTSVVTNKPNYVKSKFSAFANTSSNVQMLFHVTPVRVRVSGTNKYVLTNAFFDNGSNCSFISDSLKKKLGVTGPLVLTSV